MLTAMVWGPAKATSTKFPAIEIRPRPSALALRSSSSTLNDAGVGDATIRPRAERTATAEDASSWTAVALDSSHRLSEHGGSPPKRARVNLPGASSGPRERRQHKCSICSQVFARAEHLTRHERSHRKERPFSCAHCNATFTRKDLVKRHLSRNHPDLVVSAKPGEAERAVDEDARDSGQNGSGQGTSPAQTSLPQPGTHSQSSPFESDPLPNSQEMGRLMDVMGDLTHDHQMEGSVLDHFDFESLLRDANASQLMLQTPSALAGVLGDDTNPGLHFSFDSPMLSHAAPHFAPTGPDAPFANPLSAVPSRPESPETDPVRFINGPRCDEAPSSFFISEAKRTLLMHDTEAVFSLARVPDTFRVPSCLAMERYITAFFDSFLVHGPCIHVPTFQAEHAQPSLILAMAALGAHYHEEKDVAMQLYRAARLSILNQMEKTSFTSKGRPTWILQSQLFTMAFGVWGGDFDAVQESLAFQSNLGHIVRYVSQPGACWVDDTQDPSLSWEDWIELESAKRTKFVIYTFFNDLTVGYNVPPVIANSEVDMDLPCDESTWAAASAMSWSTRRSLLSAPFQLTLRSLMSSPDVHTIQCSTFGCHIILSALSQQIWQSRQSAAPSENLSGLPKFEAALQNWQAIAAEAESSVLIGTLRSESPLSSDSMALLRLAHVMLSLDTSKLKTVICRQDAQGIAQAMRFQYGTVSRSATATRTALVAIHAFRRVVKAGVNIVARRGSLEVSPQVYLSWFDSCEYHSDGCCAY